MTAQKLALEQARRRRARLRQRSLPAPNDRSPAFCVEAHRQSLAVAASVAASEDQDFIDAVSEIRRDEVVREFVDLEAFCKTMPSMSVEEMLSARHEGHKF